MLTHGMDGKHKTKAHKMVRGAGYAVKRSTGGSLSAASKAQPATRGQVMKAVAEHETHEHGGKHTKLKLKSGGVASSEKSHARPDRASRLKHGGKAKAPHTKINIMVAPGKSDSPAAPAMGPRPAMPPMAAPPAAPAGPMAGGVPPMGARPPGMPLKTGGVAKAQGGKKITGYEAGAGSGEGRLEKEKNYKKYVKKY